MSAIELPRLQRPEPNMDLLPPLSMKQFHRYASDTKPGRFPRNMSSRTALITADSVPQFEWTRADCCDWISKFLQGNFNIPEHLAQHKASMSQENGEGLYHTSLWHWRDRCGVGIWKWCGLWIQPTLILGDIMYHQDTSGKTMTAEVKAISLLFI
ncbi:uncharacterized protein RSE6_09560 [Rhynchosporium secalis]|uniref:Uncharacterized protein n=1 Tax=Rhynchosporium secalis TaxID=38038 RepID=A0A1E1MIB0_RHYSE|nr:uncharacterized protein RSE6_09560 [Rhynchosporium secalis]